MAKWPGEFLTFAASGSSRSFSHRLCGRHSGDRSKTRLLPLLENDLETDPQSLEMRNMNVLAIASSAAEFSASSQTHYTLENSIHQTKRRATSKGHVTTDS